LDLLTAKELQRRVKRDKNHYSEQNDDKALITCYHGFVGTAQIHHTDYVLDKTYVSFLEMHVAVAKDMQTFMYSVLYDHLKSDKGKILECQLKLTSDTPRLFCESKEKVLSSTSM
jgi:hypothetical protein